MSRERFRSFGARFAVSGAGELSLPQGVSPPSRGAQTSQATFRVLNLLLLTLFAVALVALEVAVRVSFGWDFNALYQAGREYLHLHSPYVSGSLAQLTSRENFVYPLPIAAIFAPVSLLPYDVAAAMFVAMGAACLALALRILGVRDWRCYAAVLVGIPAFEGVGLGTISPLLALLLALLWRYRDRGRVAIPVVTLLVLAKLFLWPVLVWLLLTRRFRTAVIAIAACAASVIVFSLPVGLGALVHYPVLLRSLSSFEAPMSMSLLSFGQGLTGSYVAGMALTAAAGGALLYGMVRAARHGDELRVFCLSVVAALAMSPIVWNHYLLLLFVPLALTRPRFSVLWLASAWILGDGYTLGRTGLAILTAAAWLVILAQGGVLSRRPTNGARRERQLFGVPSLAGAFALWVALGWGVLALAGQVTAFAALTPPARSGSASGTATLRVLHDRNEICWNILTTGIPPSARAEIVQRGKVLAQSAMEAGRSETCVGYTPLRHKNLAAPFAADRVHLRLKIVGSGGVELLGGRILRNPPTVISSGETAGHQEP